MKQTFFVLAMAVVVLSSCNKGGGSAELKDQRDSLSYSLGVLMGQNFKESELTDINFDVFLKAVADHGDSTEVIDLESADQFVRLYFEGREALKTEEQGKKNTDFLEANKSKEGVQTTSSGLQYKVITQGTGAQADANDSVTVHYEGKLIDGKVFDSSKDTDKPVTFLLNRPMITGFVEGVQLMKEGGKYEIYIPSELGYGERGAGTIEPGSTLIFEIELLKVYSVN